MQTSLCDRKGVKAAYDRTNTRLVSVETSDVKVCRCCNACVPSPSLPT